MLTNPINATIAEIARKAGVGTATVDRVINGRAGVNPDTAIKVMKIIGNLGKTPLRGRPRLSENFRFAFVLPASDTPFLNMVDRQIALSAPDFRHQHITEVSYRFDAADATEFANALSQLTNFQGVAVLAPDLPPVKQAINKLVAAGVSVVTLFSDVAGSMRAGYMGADNRAAGRTAGLLLGRMAGNAKKNTLLLSSQATRLTGEIDRRIGFAQVIQERFPHLRVVRTPDLPESDGAVQAAMQSFLKSDVDPATLSGIYNVGAGTAGLVDAVQAAGLTDQLGVISHDFTDAHSSLLSAGRLSYVLNQDIHYSILSSARVMRALCENVRGALNVVQPRLEILTAENLH